MCKRFGPNPWLWFLPVCNTTGDGWRWDVSSEWLEASDASTLRRAANTNTEQRGHYAADADGVAYGYNDTSNQRLQNCHGVSLQELQGPYQGFSGSKGHPNVEESSNGPGIRYEGSSENDADTDAGWGEHTPPYRYPVQDRWN